MEKERSFTKFDLLRRSQVFMFVLVSIRFKVSSVLPSLHLKLSDDKFKMLMKVRETFFLINQYS